MIDRETVLRIKDAANIVDVVNEFVTLRKAGTNFKGLCPFHNEKTPSFIVSPNRGTCHCFGCGKGGDAVSFIMEHEQMTYPEALRWLAKKYHIEIRERELSDEEKREQSERESMFIVNEWTVGYFEDLLQNNVDGVAIGKQYFRSRGFRDDVIRKFHLGYDLSNRTALAKTALSKGYKEEFLLKTGICYKNDQGELIDRYAGRVVFPWYSNSGRVVGFTARVLDARTKGVNQKYVNSPDSEIFHKAHHLYGIFQAKAAMSKLDHVFLVEGQADVVSMHQSGIENVVAGSGTALSLAQIQMLRRYTKNITLIYDNDAAGIHAAMRGLDMLLSEGMNLKILLLPEGEDPDSFARKNTAADFKKYIEEHQTDFIQFKTALLLNNERDPLKRSEAINSIVQSISYVTNPILRDTYLHDCADRMGMNEATLINTMNKLIHDRKKNSGQTSEQAQAPQTAVPQPSASEPTAPQQFNKIETLLVQLIVRYGERIIFENVENEETHEMFNLSVAQYVHYNFSSDNLLFHDPRYNTIMEEAYAHSNEPDFKCEPYFVHHQDIEIARLSVALSTDSFHLSESQQVNVTQESLRANVMHLILDFRREFVETRLKEVQQAIKTSGSDPQAMMQLMNEFKDLMTIRNAIARELGNNIIV